MAEPGRNRMELPWTPENGETGRFGLSLLLMLVLCLPPAILIPLTEVPEPDRNESADVPPRLARLIEKQDPPEPVSAPEPVKDPEPEPEKAEKLEEEPAPDSRKEVRQPPDPAPGEETDSQSVEQARATASRSGLLAMKDQLAALRAPESDAEPALVANVSDNSGHLQSDDPGAGEALSGSGGVAGDRGPTKQVQVEEHQVREVAVAPEQAPKPVAKPDRGPDERGMSNIRQVFDAQKTALYSLYRRELRQDPTLEGKVLLELVIEPDGSVSRCEVVSSELDHPELERRIATRVQLFNFGADDVAARKVKFPIDFLPG
ncbi:AgmX/PglI C-terminal domain-containing protein [Marinobacter sp. GN3S48]|uniref:AgmX/PglI C-terminal domain-containing protein n=1 Tax=Marinobacter sp. GN3S48 TaxID=3382302 RepID=UPI00387AE641